MPVKVAPVLMRAIGVATGLGQPIAAARRMIPKGRRLSAMVSEPFLKRGAAAGDEVEAVLVHRDALGRAGRDVADDVLLLRAAPVELGADDPGRGDEAAGRLETKVAVRGGVGVALLGRALGADQAVHRPEL